MTEECQPRRARGVARKAGRVTRLALLQQGTRSGQVRDLMVADARRACPARAASARQSA